MHDQSTHLKHNLDEQSLSVTTILYTALYIECITWCITLNGGQKGILNLRTDGMTIGNASLINNSFTVALVKYINREWQCHYGNKIELKEIHLSKNPNKMKFCKITQLFSLFVLFYTSNATSKQF